MLLDYRSRTRIMEQLRSLLGGNPRYKQVAALPWRRTDRGLEFLLVTSRGTGRWVLPKGWPEGTEEPYHAASREAEEEAGISGEISQEAAGRYYYSKRRASGAELQCEVMVFPLEVKTIADDWRERRKRRRRWFSPQDAARLVSEPDLGELLGNYGNI